jgi:hypothetical protein
VASAHHIRSRRHFSRDITNRPIKYATSVPLNCHFVVLYPKALQSSGPLNRRHAQSHLARVLTHVTYHHPTPAEAVLIRFATAICDHQAYITRGSTRTHARERERARTKRTMQIVHVTAPLTLHIHDSDNNPASTFYLQGPTITCKTLNLHTNPSSPRSYVPTDHRQMKGPLYSLPRTHCPFTLSLSLQNSYMHPTNDRPFRFSSGVHVEQTVACTLQACVAPWLVLTTCGRALRFLLGKVPTIKSMM